MWFTIQWHGSTSNSPKYCWEGNGKPPSITLAKKLFRQYWTHLQAEHQNRNVYSCEGFACSTVLIPTPPHLSPLYTLPQWIQLDKVFLKLMWHRCNTGLISQNGPLLSPSSLCKCWQHSWASDLKGQVTCVSDFGVFFSFCVIHKIYNYNDSSASVLISNRRVLSTNVTSLIPSPLLNPNGSSAVSAVPSVC